jgi:hypothetical protein
MCVPCSLEYNCIDRSPKYSISITSPVLIKVYENDLREHINKTDVNYKMNLAQYLRAINSKYENQNNGLPYDTGTLIKLITNDDNDPNNNILFMSSVIMIPNSTEYSYKWIQLMKKDGIMQYNGKDNNLKIKYCNKSYRILSVDNNYELIGYNYPLDISTMINLFEKNNFSYRRFFFYPNFSLSDLKSDRTYSKKPKFIQRKLINIYKYLQQHPNQKFITPNVSVVNGKYFKYQFDNINAKLYIDDTYKFLEELRDINDFHNDDEDDDDYIEYFDYYKEMKKLNFKERHNYRIDMVKEKIKKYQERRNNNKIVNDIINKKLSISEDIINQHDLVPFEYKNNGILYKCSICKQVCFVEN